MQSIANHMKEQGNEQVFDMSLLGINQLEVALCLLDGSFQELPESCDHCSLERLQAFWTPELHLHNATMEIQSERVASSETTRLRFMSEFPGNTFIAKGPCRALPAWCESGDSRWECWWRSGKLHGPQLDVGSKFAVSAP